MRRKPGSTEKPGNKRRKLRRVVLLALLVGVLGFAASQNVSTDLTDEDRVYAERILTAAGYGEPRQNLGVLDDFEGQVRAIVAVQDAVLTVAPGNEGIALGQAREPKDVFEARSGLCFDRSRAIEKLLAYLGLEVRHVAIYATTERSTLAAIVTPENSSHAVSEALTDRGWLLIDSNARWIGLGADRQPVSVAGLQSRADRAGGWAVDSKSPINRIFVEDHTYIYGLYSRHGRFYPPFTPFPDVNYRQLLGNF